MERRIAYWDIVKGIGIVSIVLGHSCFFAVKWVYAYHMMLFFFVSGYLYSDTKYKNRPAEYLGKKIGNFLPKFIIYESLLIIFNNVFVSLGICEDLYKQTIKELVRGILNTAFFQHAYFGGSAWFVPLLIVTSGVFAYIIFLTDFYVRAWTAVGKMIVFVFLLMLSGGIGAWLCMQNWPLAAYGHLALLLQPIMGGAFLLKKFYDLYSFRQNCVTTIIGILLSIAILIWLMEIEDGFIDISASMIISPLKFYMSSFSGIYLCLIVAKWIESLSFLRNIISYIGRLSFEIMVFHIMSFKLVDYVYTILLEQGDVVELGRLPYSYKNLWLVYLIGGIAIPISIKFIIGKINAIIVWTMKGLYQK